MAIGNRQIGWSNESNLLWLIAKQTEQLTRVISTISGGSVPPGTYVPYTGATEDVYLVGVDLYAQKIRIGGWEPTYYGYELGQEHVGLFRENGDTPIATYDSNGYYYAGEQLKYDLLFGGVVIDGLFKTEKGVNDGVSDYYSIITSNSGFALAGISGSDGDNFGRVFISADPDYGIESISRNSDNTLISINQLNKGYITTSSFRNDTSGYIQNIVTNTDTSESTTVNQTATSFTYNGEQIATVKYKVYTAFLTQSGTSTPTANVLENTIGTVSIGRSNVGLFTFNSTGAFPTQSKIWFSATNADGDNFTGTWDYTNADTIQFLVQDASTATLTDFTDFSIEIRVYP